MRAAYLDSEQRIMSAKIIKRFIMHSKKTAFIVEHDFIMAAYLADRVIVYEGQPSKEATACTPQSLLSGGWVGVGGWVGAGGRRVGGARAGWGGLAQHPPTHPPPSTGMNSFLKNLNITFRRDPTNYRPRINKKDSTKDREQKVGWGGGDGAGGMGCVGGAGRASIPPHPPPPSHPPTRAQLAGTYYYLED